MHKYGRKNITHTARVCPGPAKVADLSSLLSISRWLFTATSTALLASGAELARQHGPSCKRETAAISIQRPQSALWCFKNMLSVLMSLGFTLGQSTTPSVPSILFAGILNARPL